MNKEMFYRHLNLLKLKTVFIEADYKNLSPGNILCFKVDHDAVPI